MRVYADPTLIDVLPVNSDGPVEVVIARPDRWLGNYGGLTPGGQAYADVFNLRGWVAGRFIHEIDPRTVVDGDEQVLND